MHILRDENGNIIPHGDAGHHHDTHAEARQNCPASADCQTCEPGSAACKDETFALLNYMVNHNAHHAAEADQMADDLEKKGMADVAKQIREGVTQYQKGNMYLSVALSLYKDHLKNG